MGIFKSVKLTPQQRLDLSEELFYIGSIGKPFSKHAQKIIKGSKDRHQIYDKILELCSGINHHRAYYYKAKALTFKGAKYRVQVIHQYEICMTMLPSFSKKERIDLLNSLGEAYEGEYEFVKSLDCFMKSYSINKSIPSAYCNIALIYSKLGDLDMSIGILNKATKSKYYIPVKYKDLFGEEHTNDTFKTVIDSKLAKYKEMKERGYVYKPRQKRRIES